MEVVMVRLILAAWFLLFAIVFLATDLSVGYHAQQMNFAHAALDRPHIIRHQG